MQQSTSIRISIEDHKALKTLSAHIRQTHKELLHDAVGLLASQYPELYQYLPAEFDVLEPLYTKRDRGEDETKN